MKGTISPNENWLVTILGITEPTYTGGQLIKVMINSSKGKFGLCPLMTPGLSKTFGVMYTSTCLNLQITRSDIRTHTQSWLSTWWLALIAYICLMVTVIYLKDLSEVYGLTCSLYHCEEKLWSAKVANVERAVNIQRSCLSDTSKVASGGPTWV